MFNFLKPQPSATVLKHKTQAILGMFTYAQEQLEQVAQEQILLGQEKEEEVKAAEQHVLNLKDEVKAINQDLQYTNKMLGKITNFLS